ncbi:toxin-antitoxin system HicB family antitoxin [Rhizobium sp. CNPSo 4062]|uniref:toxin-antitoxin system HicB family antitoxin n=1 Tax=Rhizobium sp. CNPSo 4062 TaxID=3021410 RepID=UPI0025519FEB|nr:toxin-antitoxin system HicB family antitoxin [Rhizobium sp. CNPSo 4062]MDK4706185.1 toxin-antitoxin system HicB family antitoxin [Rhizobium sp. CNPSo 4062]
MSTLTIRLPNDQHERLKALAASRGTSLNRLFEELTTRALTEFDAETRFRLRAAKGDRTRGLDILEKLDRAHSQRT